MEPLRDWFCKGADLTSPAEYEAALCQIEEYPPDIRQYNDNIREERWTQFSLEGAKFPTATVDVIQRDEALATFERDLIIRFQHIWKAAALYARALGGVKQALEVYRRVDHTSNSYPWSLPTTEQVWHAPRRRCPYGSVNQSKLATRRMAKCKALESRPQVADSSSCWRIIR